MATSAKHSQTEEHRCSGLSRRLTAALVWGSARRGVSSLENDYDLGGKLPPYCIYMLADGASGITNLGLRVSCTLMPGLVYVNFGCGRARRKYSVNLRRVDLGRRSTGKAWRYGGNGSEHLGRRG